MDVLCPKCQETMPISTVNKENIECPFCMHSFENTKSPKEKSQKETSPAFADNISSKKIIVEYQGTDVKIVIKGTFLKLAYFILPFALVWNTIVSTMPIDSIFAIVFMLPFAIVGVALFLASLFCLGLVKTVLTINNAKIVAKYSLLGIVIFIRSIDVNAVNNVSIDVDDGLGGLDIGSEDKGLWLGFGLSQIELQQLSRYFHKRFNLKEYEDDGFANF